LEPDVRNSVGKRCIPGSFCSQTEDTKYLQLGQQFKWGTSYSPDVFFGCCKQYVLRYVCSLDRRWRHDGFSRLEA
jgi:hypothetical protein